MKLGSFACNLNNFLTLQQHQSTKNTYKYVHMYNRLRKSHPNDMDFHAFIILKYEQNMPRAIQNLLYNIKKMQFHNLIRV